MHKNKTILLTWTNKAEIFLFDKEFWQWASSTYLLQVWDDLGILKIPPKIR